MKRNIHFLNKALSVILVVVFTLSGIQLQSIIPEPVEAGTPSAPDLRGYDKLGDWVHYGSIIFDTLVAHQADTEAPMAVGKRAHFVGSLGGFDIGDSITEANSVIGYYDNEEDYPSFLFGGNSEARSNTEPGPANSLYFGTNPASNPNQNASKSYAVYGGAIAMTEEMHARNVSRRMNSNYAGALSTAGKNGIAAGSYDKVTQEDLDTWFDYWYRYITGAQQQYLEAGNDGDHTITIRELINDPTSAGRYNYWWWEKSSAKLGSFVNNTLTEEGSDTPDDRTLVINVDMQGNTSWIFNTDTWWGYNDKAQGGMQIPAGLFSETTDGTLNQLKLKYDLIIFNFPGLVNVQFGSIIQHLQGSVIKDANGSLNPNKYWKNMSEAEKLERIATCCNVVYSFPDAKTINHSSGFFSGSVLAPQASYNGNGGSLNGQLVAQNYTTTGGNEIHALSLNRKILKVTKDPDPDGKIQLFKYLKYNGKLENTRLNGSEFILYREDDNGEPEYYTENQTFSADRKDAAVYMPGTESSADIEKLAYGDYWLEEIKAPTGFTLNKTDESDRDTYYLKAATVSEEEKTVVVNQYNEPLSTDVYFKKFVKDKNGEQPLGGAEFRLTRLGDDFFSETTQLEEILISADEDGVFAAPKLPVGKYILTEITPPSGYSSELENGEFRFTIRNINGEIIIHTGHDDEGYQDTSLHIDCTRESPYPIENVVGAPETALYLYKYEEGDSTHSLAGAEFEIYRQDDESGIWIQIKNNGKEFNPSFGVDPSHIDYKGFDPAVTGDTGYIYISRLDPGTYRIVETATVQGYLLENKKHDDNEHFPDGYAAQFEIEVPDGVAVPAGLPVTTEGESDKAENASAEENSSSELDSLDLEDGSDETDSSDIESDFDETDLPDNGEGTDTSDDTEGAEDSEEPPVTTEIQPVQTLLGQKDGMDTPDPPVLAEGTTYVYVEISNKKLITGLNIQKWGSWADEIRLIDTAGFRVERKNSLTGQYAEFAASITSGGKLQLTGLTEGDYRIIESDAPAGYVGLEGDFLNEYFDAVYFTVAFAGEKAEYIDIRLEYYDSEKEDLVVSEPDTGPPTADGPLTFTVDEEGNLIIQLYNQPVSGKLTLRKKDAEMIEYGIAGEDEDYRLEIKYLDGARFVLQRQAEGFSGEWQLYGGAFEVSYLYEDGNPVNDQYGNHLSAVTFPNPLIYGQYRVLEIQTPDGYSVSPDALVRTINYGGTEVTAYEVHNFAVSETGGLNQSETFEVVNYSEAARSDITIHKVDSNGEPVEGAPYRLWAITGGESENWDADVTLEDALADWSNLRFWKFFIEGGLQTDANGKLTLENLSPGVYGIFEMWNDEYQQQDDEFLEKYLYFLSHQSTVPEDSEDEEVEDEFYYHLTTFKVVAADPDDNSKGVRIKWVHQSKLWNNEAEFDNQTHNSPGWSWEDYKDDDSRLEITLVNKLREDLPVDVSMRKTDENGDPLEGAKFELYRRTDFTRAIPIDNDYEKIGEATSSGADAAFTFTGLDAVWRWNLDKDGHLKGEIVDEADSHTNYRNDEDVMMWNEYMIKEAEAPDGYVESSQRVNFMLWANPLSKMLDLIKLDYAEDAYKFPELYDYLEDPPAAVQQMQQLFGSTPMSLNTGNFESLAWWRKGYSDPDPGETDYPNVPGTFVHAFDLGEIMNQTERVDFVVRKVDGEDHNITLAGAGFLLLSCTHEHDTDCGGETNPDDCTHTHSTVYDETDSDNCWGNAVEQTSEQDGLFRFTGLVLGEYRLAEIRAPEGYELPHSQWQVVIGKSDPRIEITAVDHLNAPALLAADDEDEADYLLENHQTYILPLVGGRSIRRYILLGILLLLAGAGAYWYSRKRRSSGKEGMPDKSCENS